MNTIIIRPLITEKTLTLAGRGWYTFMVAIDAVKANIAHAVSTLYKVKVMEVRTIHMHGKVRRAGKGMKARKKMDWKKAIVHLAKGQKIDAFEVTGAPESEKPVATAKQKDKGK